MSPTHALTEEHAHAVTLRSQVTFYQKPVETCYEPRSGLLHSHTHITQHTTYTTHHTLALRGPEAWPWLLMDKGETQQGKKENGGGRGL